MSQEAFTSFLVYFCRHIELRAEKPPGLGELLQTSGSKQMAAFLWSCIHVSANGLRRELHSSGAQIICLGKHQTHLSKCQGVRPKILQ